MTFGVIFPPNPRGKNSTNSQINSGILDETKNSKEYTIKIVELVHQSYIKTYHINIATFLKIKRINGLLWQGSLILLLYPK